MEITMATSFKKGDHVTWNTSQGETEGKVIKEQTSPTKIKGHKVSASPESPQLIVESAKSGNKAAHKPEGLKKSTSDSR
jgi:hypothetical protein